ncbi:DUF202 domain-containing protein [Nesterenkonia sp. MY13]|uniref:DUF202 domain-containing protein n=1 Tax=Nesterenkonia sedimenti TaxID=1463632 RepID=A0A7X8TI26_9MICC|nr:DUF202 domain-containing protein [Nesterenkonia sedimenti]NLS08850.1 DUF202 domain-containing protein [Nesterenkonia sedimenti]
MSLMTYILMDFWRNLRNFGNSFFIIVLPAVLFLIFGVSADWNEFPLPTGTGNVSAHTLIGIAVYGAATATTSLALLAGGVAVEALTQEIFEPTVRTLLAVLLLVLGVALSAGAFWRWLKVERRVRQKDALPLPLIAPLLGAGIAVVSALLIWAMLA